MESKKLKSVKSKKYGYTLNKPNRFAPPYRQG